MTPVIDVTTAIPRITVDGWESHYTFGNVIDHTNRTVQGAIIETPESDPLTDCLRSLRKGQVVDLRFISVKPDEGFKKEIVRIEYEGKATPIMVRVRPSRRDVACVKFKFRLLE